jgi:hypothetical protein
MIWSWIDADLYVVYDWKYLHRNSLQYLNQLNQKVLYFKLSRYRNMIYTMSVFNHATWLNLRPVDKSAISVVSRNRAAWIDNSAPHWITPSMVWATVRGYPTAVGVRTGTVALGWSINWKETALYNNELFQFQTVPKTAVCWPGFLYSRALFLGT